MQLYVISLRPHADRSYLPLTLINIPPPYVATIILQSLKVVERAAEREGGFKLMLQMQSREWKFQTLEHSGST